MKAVILAGGSGTRLWPASTQRAPKQFLDINGDGELLLQTLRRCANLGINDCFVVTRDSYAVQVATVLAAFNPEAMNNVLLEPCPRNTAPAILLSAKFLEYQNNASLDDVMLVLPSDHLITQTPELMEAFQLGEKLAQEGQIVTFGVVPEHPETGYGYIKTQPGIMYGETEFFPIQAFKEKPNLETAQSYLQEGGYYWNAGIFALSLRTLYQEMERYFPESKPYLAMDYPTLLDVFAEVPAISFDYAVMEKTEQSVVVPLSAPWSDVGSWDSVYDVLPKDENGNITQGNVILHDVSNSLAINKSSRPMGLTGLNNMIAVQTNDGLLMASRGNSQNVRHIIATLEQQLAQALTTSR